MKITCEDNYEVFVRKITWYFTGVYIINKNTCIKKNVINHRGTNKGGKFLKKVWCCVGRSITRYFGFINPVDKTKLSQRNKDG